MIKNVVFDIGMVLADFRWRKYLRDDLKFPPEVCREIGEKIVQTTMWDDLDLGVRDADEVIEEMKSKLPQYRKETDLFFNGIENIARAYPYSTPWIQDLKSRGYMVYLLSNYPRDYFKLHEKKSFDFVKYTDGKIVSGFEKLAKPDPRIYKLLFERYSLDPTECVFIDDRQINIDAAMKLGMKTILFTDHDSVRKKLDEMLG